MKPEPSQDAVEVLKLTALGGAPVDAVRLSDYADLRAKYEERIGRLKDLLAEEEVRERLLSEKAKTAGAARLRDRNSMLPWRDLGPQTREVERQAAGYVISGALDHAFEREDSNAD